MKPIQGLEGGNNSNGRRKPNLSVDTARTGPVGEGAPLLVVKPPLPRSSSLPLPLSSELSTYRNGNVTPDGCGEHYPLDYEDDDDDGGGLLLCADTEDCGIAALRKQPSIFVKPPEALPTSLRYATKPLLHTPYLPWLRYRGYFKKNVWKDMMAGVVVSVVAIPQGLAYAVLASLPPQMGLYTSCIPPLIYGFLGTSRHLSAGPVALVSMFIPQIAVSLRMSHDPALRVVVAAAACVVSGILLLIVGICRLGSLVKFISSPVLAGFTTAAAVVIGVDQLQHLVGFPFSKDSSYNWDMLHDLFTNLRQTNPLTLLVGSSTVLFLVSIQHYSRRHKKIKWLKLLNVSSTLLAVVLATIASYILTQQGHYLPIVGHVPAGLPKLVLPREAVTDLASVGNLVLACMPVTCLAFMSSWSLARNYAVKSGQADLDANQEAVALGAANFVAGFFLCFPSSGSFGRTSLNAQNGARSPLSNISASLAVFFCLLFFTPYLYYLPMCCLGAVIQVSLISLFDLKPFKRAFKISKPDFVVTMTTFLFTAMVNIEVGLVTGIVVSICVLLQELSEIHTSTLVPIMSGGGRYIVRSQSVDPMNHPLESQDIKVVRLTASLFFGNKEEMKTQFENLLMAGDDHEPIEGREDGHSSHGGELGLMLSSSGHPPKAIVIDASGVSHLDLSGVEAVEHLYKLATEMGVKLAFVQAKGVFRDRLRASKLWEKIGGEAYESLSVDEVVTRLVSDLGMPPLPAGGAHWGSPKIEGSDLPVAGEQLQLQQQQGGKEKEKNVSLHRHHHHHRNHHAREPADLDLAGGLGQPQAQMQRINAKRNERHTRRASGRGLVYAPVHEGNEEAELAAEKAEEREAEVEGGGGYGQYGSV
ncbi:hypothetical protein VYU27_000817 [Nannochloropsis oceanica]